MPLSTKLWQYDRQKPIKLLITVSILMIIKILVFELIYVLNVFKFNFMFALEIPFYFYTYADVRN